MKGRRVFAFLLLLACAQVCLAQKGKEKKFEPPPPSSDEEMENLRRSYPVLFPNGRDPGYGSLPPELFSAVGSVRAPKGKDAWVVQVVSRGGLTGLGRGDVTVNSLGEVRCNPFVGPPCGYSLTPGALESLSKLVASARPSKWGAGAMGPCRDCYVTLLELRRRDAKGREKTYTVYWDDSTLAQINEEARRIFSEALAASAPSQ